MLYAKKQPLRRNNFYAKTTKKSPQRASRRRAARRQSARHSCVCWWGGTSLQQSANNKSIELTPDANGMYQIGSAEDLQKFAELVNDGTADDADAVLTTDIDLSIVCGEDIDGEEVSWTPIGTSEHPYTGTFDGQNKGVSGLSINVNMQTTDVTPDELAYGLFGLVGTGGMVENLSVDGSIDIEINTIPENEEKILTALLAALEALPAATAAL